MDHGKIITKNFHITENEVAERKKFLSLSDRDVKLLRELGHILDVDTEGILDDFYAHLRSFSEPRKLLESKGSVKRLKKLQTRYFKQLTSGVYDAEYIGNRVRVGLVHRKIGLDPHWYLSGYQYYLRKLHSRIADYYSDDEEKGQEVFAALRKVAFFDISLAIEAYIRADRQRAQASEQGFRDVIEHSPDGIVIHRDEHIAYVNPVLVHLLKFDKNDELLGRSIFEFIDDAEEDEVRGQIRHLSQTGQPRAMIETTLVCADGERLEVEVSSVPLQFDGASAIVSMVRDVTSRKKLDARMMRMDRMIAAGTLAAGVGHEINNPLTYICTNIGFAKRQLDGIAEFTSELEETLQRKLGEESAAKVLESLQPSRLVKMTEGVKEALEDAQHGSRRIRDIVGQLRSLARQHETDTCALEPEKMLEWAISMASNEIRHRAQLARDFDDIPPLRGKESRLGQVFLNLLINAAHAIEEGSVTDNEIRISAGAVDDETAFVTIEDTGKGISPEYLQRIFDPFFTTKDIGEGTGLGLHICQSIIDSYGGRIEVESEPGEGSRFTVFLPICTPDDGYCLPSTEETQELDKGRRSHILVVDDEARFRKALRRILKRDHQITLTDCGQAALQQLESGTDFDVILCDLMMPEMTGMDFFRAVERDYPSYCDRIVFMSGGAFTSRAKKFLQNTSNHYIEKPFDHEQLKVLLTEFIDQ